MVELWNALLQRCEDVYRRERRQLSYFDMTAEITQLRHECPEWADIPAVTAHRVARWLDLAYKAFFRRVRSGEAPGYPEWRASEFGRTIPLGTMAKTGWRIEQRRRNPLSWRLYYKSCSSVRVKKTWIHARGRFPQNLAGDPCWIEAYRNGDIILRGGRWYVSVCVDIEARRRPGNRPMTVEFNLIDGIARVNGRLEEADDLHDVTAIETDIDRLKSELARRYPRGRPDRLQPPEAVAEYHRIRHAIVRLWERVARLRHNFLHVWTARIVRWAQVLTIRAPVRIRDVTRSPRGSVRDPGANVATVSKLNRHILGMAPATAIRMLHYKAAEAGIRCEVVADPSPAVSVGADLVAAGKQVRRARRTVRKEAA